MNISSCILALSILSLSALPARAAESAPPPLLPSLAGEPPPPKPSRAARGVGIALVSLGGAALAGGLLSFAAALDLSPWTGCTEWSCPPSSSSSAKVIGGTVALSSGAMLMGVGFMLFFANREHAPDDPPRPTAALRPTRSGAEIVFRF